MKILIADDDAYMRAIIRDLLTNNNYDVYEADSGNKTLETARTIFPDLIVLDIIMPENGGIGVASTIRNKPEIYGNPLILMITTKQELSDILLGFESGADDYVKKPFELPELLYRVKALLKRGSAIYSKIYRYKDIVIDTERNTASERDIEVEMTKKEFDLLLMLIVNKGILINREKIMNDVWGKEYFAGSKNIEVYTKRLKDKFRCICDNLETVKGFGYRLKN